MQLFSSTLDISALPLGLQNHLIRYDKGLKNWTGSIDVLRSKTLTEFVSSVLSCELPKQLSEIQVSKVSKGENPFAVACHNLEFLDHYLKLGAELVSYDQIYLMIYSVVIAWMTGHPTKGMLFSDLATYLKHKKHSLMLHTRPVDFEKHPPSETVFVNPRQPYKHHNKEIIFLYGEERLEHLADLKNDEEYNRELDQAGIPISKVLIGNIWIPENEIQANEMLMSLKPPSQEWLSHKLAFDLFRSIQHFPSICIGPVPNPQGATAFFGNTPDNKCLLSLVGYVVNDHKSFTYTLLV